MQHGYKRMHINIRASFEKSGEYCHNRETKYFPKALIGHLPSVYINRYYPEIFFELLTEITRNFAASRCFWYVMIIEGK